MSTIQTKQWYKRDRREKRERVDTQRVKRKKTPKSMKNAKIDKANSVKKCIYCLSNGAKYNIKTMKTYPITGKLQNKNRKIKHSDTKQNNK